MSSGKLLVPVDGSDVSIKAVKLASEYAGKHDWDIVLISVVEPPPPNNFAGNAGIRTHSMNDLRDNTQISLSKAIEVLNESGLKPVTKILEGVPADVIVAEADSNPYELIIIGSKGLGRGKLQSFFLGSVAEQVIRKVKIPVLLVKND
jgi:nucleotide-binding universal stress UspA family protein